MTTTQSSCSGQFPDSGPYCVEDGGTSNLVNTSKNAPLDAWNFDSIWTVHETDYPSLQQGTLFSGEGFGTEAKPFIITSCKQFEEMNNFVIRNSYFVLNQDIDCTNENNSIMVGASFASEVPNPL